MRLLIAGLVCLVLGLSLAEYTRRHPSKHEAPTEPTTTDADAPKKNTWPKTVATLLELGEAGTETIAVDAQLAALLTAPSDAAISGFSPLTAGTFNAHHLSGALSTALFVMDAQGKSGVVLADPGKPARLIFTRPSPITAMDVDGSTVFFAEGGLVASTHSRGEEPLAVRARFKNATVVSIAASGDAVVVALMPKGVDPLSTDAVGAVVGISGSGELTLIAQDVVRPRGVRTDAKDAWWIAGAPGALHRGGLDGSFTSQLVDEAEEPLALDKDALYFSAPRGAGPELRKVGRSGSNVQTLITADVAHVTVTSGLIRAATRGAGAGLLELTSGAEATKLMDLPASARGVAVGGTSLFLLTQGDDGRSVLWAK